MKTLTLVVTIGLFAGCQSAPEKPGALTEEQQVAYQRCLEESQAVAMAWDVVEARCLAKVRGNSAALGE